jgi:hypothetical protein
MKVTDTLINTLNKRLSEESSKRTVTPKESKGIKRHSQQVIDYGRAKTSDITEKLNQRLSEEAPKKTPVKKPSNLIEKLNQRLSEKELTLDAEPTIIDPNKQDKEKTRDTYDYPFKIDWSPLLASIKKEFGEENFVKPEKEGDELLCVYFNVEFYEINSEKFHLEQVQDWCNDKGFMIVSKMPSEDYIKVYFTQIRLMDDYDQADKTDHKGSEGEEFTKANFGMDYGEKNGVKPGKKKQTY